MNYSSCPIIFLLKDILNCLIVLMFSFIGWKFNIVKLFVFYDTIFRNNLTSFLCRIQIFVTLQFVKCTIFSKISFFQSEYCQNYKRNEKRNFLKEIKYFYEYFIIMIKNCLCVCVLIFHFLLDSYHFIFFLN